MGCGSSNQVSQSTGPPSSPQQTKEKVIEDYRKRSSASQDDQFSVTQQLIKNSKPGNKGALASGAVESTGSQIDFFRMLDDKVDQGYAIAMQGQRRLSRAASMTEQKRQSQTGDTTLDKPPDGM